MSSSETPAAAPPAADPPAESSSSASETVSFIVKAMNDTKIPITVSPYISIRDLKTRLSEPASIPADRQRLIYSGRVLKDDQTIQSYKIQDGHTVHLVKGAVSSSSQPTGTTASVGTSAAAGGAGPQLPSMASGTGSDPLARIANLNALPINPSMFGADGGMGPPPDPEQVLQMMDNPQFRQTMNQMLQNPAMLDQIINSNPMFRQMGPQAREMMNTPEFREMMTNPDTLRQMTQMQRMMGVNPFGGGLGMGGGAGAGAGAGAGGGFPMPGATDQTPGTGAAPGSPPAAGAAPPNPFAPFGGLGGFGGAGAGGNPFASLFNPAAAGTTPVQTSPGASPAGNTAAPPPNPFANLFGAGAFGAPPAAGGAGASNPFGRIDIAQLQNMMNLMGGPGGAYAGGGQPPAPADTRPIEERYADQLRQLNDMGFYDFDRNCEALRRTGGSVQGAIEYLLSS